MNYSPKNIYHSVTDNYNVLGPYHLNFRQIRHEVARYILIDAKVSSTGKCAAMHDMFDFFVYAIRAEVIIR